MVRARSPARQAERRGGGAGFGIRLVRPSAGSYRVHAVDPQEPEPPAPWAPPEPDGPPPPRAGEPVGALHDHRSPSTFTLADAIRTGIGLVGQPTFLVPVLVIGVIVNAVVEAAIGPLIPSAPPADSATLPEVQAMVAALIPTFIFAVIGGILMSLYGQVWAVDASSGPFPSVSRVFGLAASRWIGVIGTGIAVGSMLIALSIGLLFLAALAEGLGRGLSVLALIPMVGIAVWVGARLSLAGWLAAEGGSILNSIGGSWRMTEGQVLRIVGWSLGYGLLFGAIGWILGELLSVVPYIGAGVTEAFSTALGFGAGVTLYRRIQASRILG